LADAERFQESLYIPGDPQFHKFFTADEFVARFARTAQRSALNRVPGPDPFGTNPCPEA
jgi:subtilase family serine protease